MPISRFVDIKEKHNEKFGNEKDNCGIDDTHKNLSTILVLLCSSYFYHTNECKNK